MALRPHESRETFGKSPLGPNQTGFFVGKTSRFVISAIRELHHHCEAQKSALRRC